MPIQSAGNAQQFGQTSKQEGKTTLMFGTDGTDSPRSSSIPGTYVSNFGPDISTSKNAARRGDREGRQEVRDLRSVRRAVVAWRPTSSMKAIASVCKSGKTPSRANVLAAMRKTNIPANKNPLGQVVKFKADGDLDVAPGYLFHINAKGKYIQIPST